MKEAASSPLRVICKPSVQHPCLHVSREELANFCQRFGVPEKLWPEHVPNTLGREGVRGIDLLQVVCATLRIAGAMVHYDFAPSLEERAREDSY